MALNAEAQALVNEVSRTAFNGSTAFFVGAGLSVESGLPSWSNLLKDLASPLGIELADGDDLTVIAQYVVNYHSGNRGALIQHLRREVGRAAEPNAYHRAIARSNVSTIWTTNYDALIERALGPSTIEVKIRDEDLTRLVDPKATEVIKMHGSLEGSQPRELVLTSEDYEDYFIARPATAQRLSVDLQRRSFLFLGYSYGDPNVANVLVEARRLSQKTTLRHFMLQRRVPMTDGQQAQMRQELWRIDLRRIGIDCVLVEDYPEVLDALQQIALRSRGPTVFATGSHEKHNEAFAQAVGRRLAEAKSHAVVMLDGQSTGTGRSVITAFQEGCVRGRIDLRDRIRFFPNPYAANPAFSNDQSLLPTLQQWRASLLRSAHTVIAFDGGMGTTAEVEIARSLGCRIVPVPQLGGGLASQLIDDVAIAKELERTSPGFMSKARKFSLTEEDVVACVLVALPGWR